MAEYSKAQKLQALEFLAQYLNGEARNSDLLKRALYGSIPELSGYLDNKLEAVPEILKEVASGDKDSQVKAERFIQGIEGRVAGQTQKANYFDSNNSHHPIALSSQYVMGAELPMEEARQLYNRANEEGYPVGTQLQHMLSLPRRAHDEAHISPRTGRIGNYKAGVTTFAAVNDAMREVIAEEAAYRVAGGNKPMNFVNTNLALSIPHLEREKQNSLSVFNSPGQVALRNELANELGIPSSVLSDAVNPATSRKNSQSLAAKAAADLSAKGFTKDNIDSLYEVILLQDPELAKKQDKLLDDLSAGISDNEISSFNQMLSSDDGNYKIAANVPQSVEEAMMDVAATDSVRLNEATDLIDSMSKDAVKAERIKRQQDRMLKAHPKGKGHLKVEANYPDSIQDVNRKEVERILSRLRPGAETTLGSMSQNIPGLNQMISAFKARRRLA